MTIPAATPLSACADCSRIDRRTFLAQTTVAAVTALLAGCGVSSTGPSDGLPLTVNLSDFPALAAVGGMARVDGGRSTPVAVVHNAPETYLAFSLVCPHQGFLVDLNGGAFLCSGHGARFNATGQWTGGQRTTNLHNLDLVYDAAMNRLTIG